MNTAEKILKAALDLFSEKGYSATTTKMIAQKADVNEVTLYRHFDNKRGIFNAIIEDLIDTKKINEFYESGITNNLKADLKELSIQLQNVYMINAAVIRMIFMDDELTHNQKKSKINRIIPIRKNLSNYFHHMYDIGEMSDNPEKCMKFFFFNVIGYLMNVNIMAFNIYDDEYYNWMVDKTIAAITE